MTALDSLFGIADAQQIPLATTVELTAGCNLRCVHCYVTHSRRNRLSLEVLTRLFDELEAAGGLYLTMTGGEIALRPDLFEIIEEARRRRFAVHLLTSGTLWEPREWDRVAELGVANVRLSLYACDPAIHDAITRTPGSHAKTLATARALIARHVRVALGCPVMQMNAAQVPQVAELAAELGADLSVDFRITWTDDGCSAPARTIATCEQQAILLEAPQLRTLTGVGERTPWLPQDTPCGVARSSSFVRCDGELLPCVNWPEGAGNVLDLSFRELWSQSPVLTAARAVNKADLPTCAMCDHREHCHPCVAMNLQENGSMAVPSLTVCSVAAASARVQTSRGEKGGTS